MGMYELVDGRESEAKLVDDEGSTAEPYRCQEVEVKVCNDYSSGCRLRGDAREDDVADDWARGCGGSLLSSPGDE